MSEQEAILAIAQAIVSRGKAAVKATDLDDNTEHVFEVSYKEHPAWPFDVSRDGIHWNRIRDLNSIIITLRRDEYVIVEVS